MMDVMMTKALLLALLWYQPQFMRLPVSCFPTETGWECSYVKSYIIRVTNSGALSSTPSLEYTVQHAEP